MPAIKTPNKRQSLSNNEQSTSTKKMKLNNNTPGQYVRTPNKSPNQKTPKVNNTGGENHQTPPALQSPNKKLKTPKLNNAGGENHQALTPQSPNKKQKTPKVNNASAENHQTPIPQNPNKKQKSPKIKNAGGENHQTPTLQSSNKKSKTPKKQIQTPNQNSMEKSPGKINIISVQTVTPAESKTINESVKQKTPAKVNNKGIKQSESFTPKTPKKSAKKVINGTPYPHKIIGTKPVEELSNTDENIGVVMNSPKVGGKQKSPAKTNNVSVTSNVTPQNVAKTPKKGRKSLNKSKSLEDCNNESEEKDSPAATKVAGKGKRKRRFSVLLKNDEDSDSSPKKLKPFEGTSQLEDSTTSKVANKTQDSKVKNKNNPSSSDKTTKKLNSKQRRSREKYNLLREALKGYRAGDRTLISQQEIEVQIKNLTPRADTSKRARRMLRNYHEMLKLAQANKAEVQLVAKEKIAKPNQSQKNIKQKSIASIIKQKKKYNDADDNSVIKKVEVEKEESDDDSEVETEKAVEEVEKEESDDDDDSEVEAEKKIEVKINTTNKKIIQKKPNEENKKGYVVFVGNLPFEINEDDLRNHFSKAGEIKNVRIPKHNDQSKGIAFVELDNEEAYQKALSLHRTFINGRQINVEYTKQGSKNNPQRRQEIKAKNMKLHTMRKQGALAGSVKETQKRSFRRAKGRQNKEKGQNEKHE